MPTDSEPARPRERSEYVPELKTRAERDRLKASLLDEWETLVWNRELRPAGTAPGRRGED